MKEYIKETNNVGRGLVEGNALYYFVTRYALSESQG